MEFGIVIGYIFFCDDFDDFKIEIRLVIVFYFFLMGVLGIG